MHDFYFQTCQSVVYFVIKHVRAGESELFAGHYVFVCVMCSLVCARHTLQGALKLRLLLLLFFFLAFGCFSVLKKNGISAFSSSTNKH